MYFWSYDKMPMSYDQSKERYKYKAQMLYMYFVNKDRVTYIAALLNAG
jgi:hypothetical protein